jgi:DNA-binding response OmpR family regulator
METLPAMQTILVCDDDELLVELLTHRLGARGYHVVVAADGGAAVRQALECDPDAIVLDMMMPVLDGQQVLRRLKADPATADIPVIMLTARRQERDIVGTLELGADDYLVKPFIPEELMSRLARLVTTRR